MPVLYEITLRAQYFQQLCINRFHYLADGNIGFNPSAIELLTLLGFIPGGIPPVIATDTLFGQIRDLVSDQVLFLEAECRNLYSTTDFYVAAYSPPFAGLTDGVACAPFLAYGLFSSRVRTDIRRGTKRLVGVVEEATEGGGGINTDFADDVADVAAKMSEVHTGVTVTYYPAVLAYDKYVTPKGNDAYRPWPTEAEQAAHAAFPVTWGSYADVRSQTSRQYNRGS